MFHSFILQPISLNGNPTRNEKPASLLPGRQNYAGSEGNTFAVEIFPDFFVYRGVDLRPHLRRHAIQQGTERHRHRSHLLPNLVGRARPRPWQRSGFLFHVAEAGLLKNARKAAGLRKAERIRPARLEQRPAHMAMYDAHHALPEWLLETAPGQKAGARSRF